MNFDGSTIKIVLEKAEDVGDWVSQQKSLRFAKTFSQDVDTANAHASTEGCVSWQPSVPVKVY